MEQLSLFDVPTTTVIPKFEAKQKSDTWLLIDGNNLMNRCYYATAHNPRNMMKSSDGRYTNAVTGFLRMMLRYEEELGAKAVVMFDEGKGFRKELYPEYKNGRSETPEALTEQVPLIKDLLKAANIPIFMSSVYEADDLIGSFTKSVSGDMYILSNDKDLYQLVNDRVTVIARKNQDDVYITPPKFEELFAGLSPKQIVDLKAITGDSSDNIPGIRGIGEPGALKLLQHFSTLENMIEATEFPKELNRYRNKVSEQAETAKFAKKLTTLSLDIPIEIPHLKFNREALMGKCNELGIYSIVKKLKK